MESQCSNFIYIKENLVSEDFCNALIQDARTLLDDVPVSLINDPINTSPVGKHNNPQRQDAYVFSPPHLQEYTEHLYQKVFEAYDEYCEFVPSVKTHKEIAVDPVKVQRTKAGQYGFSTFHHEHGSGYEAFRVLAWMIYLNDIEEGGATEFPYQAQIIQPRAGTVAIWPSGITHPHRGNVPYSGDKWVVTGWFSVPPYPWSRMLTDSKPQ